jgi:hypothetical protein
MVTSGSVSGTSGELELGGAGASDGGTGGLPPGGGAPINCLIRASLMRTSSR